MDSKCEVVSQPIYENGIWKGVKSDMPDGYFKLGERIFNEFKKNPNFIGQIDGLTGEEDTYRCMSDRSIRCALWLTKQGIRKGDIIGLSSKNQLDCSIPLFASLYLGSICSPLSHKYLDEELIRHYIDTRSPKVFFVDEQNADQIVKTAKKIGYSMPVVVLGKKTGLLSFREILKGYTDEEVEEFRCSEVKPEDPAIIINTSGTTNLPKGVLHSYSSYANMENYFENESLPSINIEFYGVNAMGGPRAFMKAVLLKYTLILVNDISGDTSFELIEKFKVTQMWMSIYTAVKLMKTPNLSKYDLSTVKLVTYGAATPEKETIEFLKKSFKNAKLYSRYSGTEFGVAICSKIDSKLKSAGKLMPNIEAKVVDSNTGKTLGPNEEGEIYCRTPKLMTGYWKNPEATAEIIDSEGWFHTGDLGYHDTDGDFFVLGRYDEFISHYKGRILSSVIVNAIKKVPGVDEVAIIPQTDIVNFEVPVAFITTVPGMQVTENDIHSVVETNLPTYIKLSSIHFLKSMPSTHNGRIAKRKLVTVFFIPKLVDIFGSKILFDSTYLKKVFDKSIKFREENEGKRGDYIDSIIALKKGKQDSLWKFEGENLFFQTGLFFSGFESSTITLIYVLVELAKNKECQDKARKDIKKAIADHGWTFEGFNNMKYLDHCISESVRLFPPVAHLDRYTCNEYKIPGTDLVLEKGTPVFMSIYGMHTDPKNFDNPKAFIPERFEEMKSQPDAYIPFGGGPRMCIGVKIGRMHVKVVISQILSQFEVYRGPEERYNLDKRSTFTASYNGINVEFKRLK